MWNRFILLEKRQYSGLLSRTAALEKKTPKNWRMVRYPGHYEVHPAFPHSHFEFD